MGANLAEIVVDVAGHIVRGVLIFGALAVNRGLHQTDRLHGGNKRNQHDIIDTLQCGERAGPQIVVEARPPGALIDMLLVRHRHNKQVAKRTGLLEMDYVPRVDEVKSAVALHNTTPIPALGIQDGFRLGKTQDFIFFHSSERASSFVTIWQTTIWRSSAICMS